MELFLLKNLPASRGGPIPLCLIWSGGCLRCQKKGRRVIGEGDKGAKRAKRKLSSKSLIPPNKNKSPPLKKRKLSTKVKKNS